MISVLLFSVFCLKYRDRWSQH